jgi:hypothetical protein
MYFLSIIGILLFFPICLPAQTYSGGNGNGFNSNTAILSLGVTDSLYNGGDEDGFSGINLLSADLSITDSTFNGGAGHGFYQSTTAGIILSVEDGFYNGGTGRGESQLVANLVNLSICGAVMKWNGNSNNAWGNAANWDCGVVPGINSIVIIPGGLLRYPIIFISTEIKSIELQSGSSITVVPGVLFKLNGQ